MLKNISQSSSEIINNTDLLPPSAVSSYSITRDKPNKTIRPPHKYEKGNLFSYTLIVVEGIESSKEPSTTTFCGVDSILGHDFSLFGYFLFILWFCCLC